MEEKGTRNPLETENTGKLMIELCMQTTFSIMLYNVYTITDTLYVSNGIGSAASGAIGIFTPILTIISGLSSTLGVGASSIISRKLGEKDVSYGRKVVGSLMWVWLVCGVFITITGLLFLEPLLMLLGCTEEIYPYAVSYARIMLLSTIASTGFSGIMRAEGDILYSTLQWCCPVLLNIVLDPIFIYSLGMGISGAALATLFAQMLSMMFYGSICAAVLYFGAGGIMAFFTSDEVILSVGTEAMQIVCWSFVTGGMVLVVQAYFQALGNGGRVLLLSLGGIFLIRIPLLITGRFIGNILAVWWEFVLSDWLAAGWSLIILIGKKKEMLWKA